MLKIKMDKNKKDGHIESCVEVDGNFMDISVEINEVVTSLVENKREFADSIVLSLSNILEKEEFKKMIDNAYKSKELAGLFKLGEFLDETSVDKMADKVLALLEKRKKEKGDKDE